MNNYYITICRHTYVLWDLDLTIISEDHHSMITNYIFCGITFLLWLIYGTKNLQANSPFYGGKTPGGLIDCLLRQAT